MVRCLLSLAQNASSLAAYVFKRRAKTASARYFPQRGFIPVSDKVINCEHEKPAKIGLIKCFGWDVGCRGTERFHHEASSGMAKEAE
jgi:hypothetical protein